MSEANLQISFKNELPFTVYVTGRARAGVHFFLAPGESATHSLDAGLDLVATARETGGVVAWFRTGDAPGYLFSSRTLTAPNAIALFDLPSPTRLIPVDTARQIVGVGTAGPNTDILIREQYWQRHSDSYMLAPGQERTVSVAQTTGRQSTTSEEQTIAEHLGFSASAGWGVISSTISGSLDVHSSFSQQIVLTEETTTFYEDAIKNPTASPVLYVKWQMMDVIQFVRAGRVAATIVTGLAPTLLSGPFDLNNLPPQAPDGWPFAVA